MYLSKCKSIALEHSPEFLQLNTNSSNPPALDLYPCRGLQYYYSMSIAKCSNNLRNIGITNSVKQFTIVDLFSVRKYSPSKIQRKNRQAWTLYTWASLKPQTVEKHQEVIFRSPIYKPNNRAPFDVLHKMKKWTLLISFWEKAQISYCFMRMPNICHKRI